MRPPAQSELVEFVALVERILEDEERAVVEAVLVSATPAERRELLNLLGWKK